MSVETRSVGMVGNFVSVGGEKAYEVALNIIGDYRYLPRNEFSQQQKGKILGYLQARVLEANAQLEDQKDTRFADYDPAYLAVLPDDFEQLRARVLKGRSNLEAAQLSLEKLRYSQEHLRARYLNEQAYEFDHMRYNSLAWGLLLGAVVNASIYRRGSAVRKAALFVTSAHAFRSLSHSYNVDRYFDAVYPIFQEDAVKFTQAEREEFEGWRPEGRAVVEE